MPSMTQKIQIECSTPHSELSSVDIFDEDYVNRGPFDETVDSAFMRLRDILASKASAEAELDDLFAKRRSHAVAELEKAKKRLDFVDQEEKRTKGLLIVGSLGYPTVRDDSPLCLQPSFIFYNRNFSPLNLRVIISYKINRNGLLFWTWSPLPPLKIPE
jgi:hypothetical protein